MKRIPAVVLPVVASVAAQVADVLHIDRGLQVTVVDLDGRRHVAGDGWPVTLVIDEVLEALRVPERPSRARARLIIASILAREIAPLILADDFTDATVGAVVGHVVTRVAGEDSLEMIGDELREVVLARERLEGLLERALGKRPAS